jgi:hypothetical protein
LKAGRANIVELLRGMIDKIMPTINDHKHRNNGICYLAWRAVVATIWGSAVKTKSALLYDDVKRSLDENVSAFSPHR